ncbi:hypothetical protein CL656_03175 [bacterium]|nr:hypothetical protein [bacterium]|tara:strand:- start:520 stop:1530 length:1011 start_codon:yes stop_codon:yes gene_type:complete
MDLSYSKYIKGWTVLSTKYQNSKWSLKDYHIDRVEYSLQEIKGEIIQNLGIIAVMLSLEPKYLVREFGQTIRNSYSICPRDRVDLVEIHKNAPVKVWEMKKSISEHRINSTQIQTFLGLFGDKFTILSADNNVNSSFVISILDLIKEARLEECINNFFHDSVYEVRNYTPDYGILLNILHKTESIVDASIFHNRPGQKAYELLMDSDLNISSNFSYVFNPEYNASIFADHRLIQTTTLAHLLPENFNNVLLIKIRSKIKGLNHLKIQVCFSQPHDILIRDSIIKRNRTYVCDEILEYIEPIVAFRSSNLNFWNFLSSLNLDFCELSRTEKLTVEID